MMVAGLHGFSPSLIAYAHTHVYTLKMEKNPINPTMMCCFLHIKWLQGSSIGGVF